MFYVYVLRHPVSKIPFYVGKGKGRRAWRHEADVRNHGKHSNPMMLAEITRIIDFGSVEVEIVLTDLQHDEACIEEMREIAKYGRRNLGTGSLLNLTDGGEGAYGRKFKHTELSKSKIAMSLAGKTPSAESNAKRREAMVGRYVGRPLTAEWKSRIGVSMTGKPQGDGKRKKLSDQRSGEGNPAAKIYELQTPAGERVEIKSLKTFCEKHGLSYDTLRRGREDQGWKVLERKVEQS